MGNLGERKELVRSPELLKKKGTSAISTGFIKIFGIGLYLVSFKLSTITEYVSCK